MTAISTLEELIEHAALVAKQEATWENVKLLPGSATVSVRVEGAGWDKRIDARGAKFIVEYQSRLNELFGQLSGDKLKAPLVKVEIKEGSNDAVAFLETLIMAGIAKMSPEDVVYLIKYAVLYGFGLWAAVKVTGQVVDAVKHKITQSAKVEQKKLDTEDRKEIVATVKEVATTLSAEQTKLVEALTQTILAKPEKLEEKVAELEYLKTLGEKVRKLEDALPENIPHESYYGAPIRNYAGSLEEKDKISVAQTTALPAPVARVAFRARRRPRSRIRWVPCDNAYVCTGLNLELKDPRLNLELDGTPIVAMIGRLTATERSSLLSRIDERMEKKQMPFHINLQIDVYYNNTGIKRATVVGIGAQRENLDHHRLIDIPNKVRKFYDEFSRPEDEIKE